MNPSKLLIASICSFFLISGAGAQEGDNLGASKEETELLAHGWRMSKLRNADVHNDAKEKIGTLDDFIVTKDGKLVMAIVDLGGFLGYGDYKVAVPVHRFSQIVPKVILPGATKEKLKKLPRFDYRIILGE